MALKILKPSFASGELNPNLTMREDLDRYYTGLSTLTNTLLAPQGGMFNMPGMILRQRLRQQLNSVSAVGGGTTGTIGTTSGYTIFSYDLITAKTVCFFDVFNITLSNGALSGQIFAQYSSDNVNWTTFGAAIDINTFARSRRIFAPAVTARYWRLARIGTANIPTISYTGGQLWAESTTLSNGKRFRFAASDTDHYRFVLSDRNIDVLKDGVQVGAISVPFLSVQVPDVTITQSFDTALLFHPDVGPYRVFRQGADDEWDWRAQVWSNMPRFDFGNSGGGVNAVQRVSIDNDNPNAKDSWKFSLEGQQTDTVRFDDADTFAVSLQAALRALNNTANGITVVRQADDGLQHQYDVTFAGSDGSRPWQEMSVVVMKGTSPASARQTVKGLRPGEDIMSGTRGYPRCGIFYQSRLNLGGFRSAPDVLVGSNDGDFFNLDIRLNLDSNAYLRRMQTDALSSIQSFFAADRLMIFTLDGGFIQPAEPATPNTVAFRKIIGCPGIMPRVPPIECDGAVIAVSPSGKVVLEYDYDANVGNFLTGSLTALCGHLINAPAAASSMSAKTDDASELYLLVNGDGTGALLNSQREQKITGWGRIQCAGKILSVDAEYNGAFGFIVERSIGGSTQRYVEDWSDDVFTECASVFTPTSQTSTAAAGQTTVNYAYASPASDDLVGVRVNGKRLSWPADYTVNRGTKLVTFADPLAAGDVVRTCAMLASVSGLDRFNGGTAWAIIDGTPVEDPIAVAGGVMVLPRAADTSVEVGLFTQPVMQLMPIKAQLPDGTMVGRQKRIVNAAISVMNTAYMEYQANDGNWYPLPLRKLGDDLLDVPLNDNGYTGEVRIEGMQGYTESGIFALRKSVPGPFFVRGIALEVQI